MLYTFARFSFALSLVVSLASSAFAAQSPLRIVIDPGHGGIDDGAVRGKVREADIALSISRELAEQLRQKSYLVTLTRQNDMALTLKQRTQIAEKAKADLFISIHANASEDHRAKGVEFYFQNQLPPDEEAAFLASKENQAHATENENLIGDSDVAQIISDLKRNYKLQSSFEFSRILAESWSIHGTQRNQMIRQAPFYVISQTTMPSVLVEVGFVTHKSEARMLTNRTHQQQIAAQITKAVEQFWEQSLATSSLQRTLASPAQ